MPASQPLLTESVDAFLAHVDTYLARQYEVAKQLYVMLSDDFEFARLRGALPYHPLVPNLGELRRSNPRRHWRQRAVE
jgi:hypothetical protein